MFTRIIHQETWLRTKRSENDSGKVLYCLEYDIFISMKYPPNFAAH